MIESVFIKILNLSIAASWLVLGIILIRVIFKRAPKIFFCALWAMVAFRLICPFSIESIISLVPSAEPIPLNIVDYVDPEIDSGFTGLNQYINPMIENIASSEAGENNNHLEILIHLLVYIWSSGVFVMFSYMLIGLVRIRNRVRESVPLEDNIWICDRINTPFIVGLLRPHILVPNNINETDMEYVIAHENAHIKRGDHLWKPVGFLILSIYWFNPVMWLAYILFCRDIEFACDEKVLKKRGIQIKKSYCTALINCSAAYHFNMVNPIAFSETGVKERVKEVLKYKKASSWICIVSVILISVMALCFLSNPVINNASSIDYSDIETMNIGSEMPYLIYGDESKVIFYGTCGIIIYDLKALKITNRLTFGYLEKKGIKLCKAYVSKDGKTIYLNDMKKIMDGSDEFDFIYQYDIDTGKLLNYSKIFNDVYRPCNFLEYDYDKEYGQYFDKNKLIGQFAIQRKNDLIYLQADNDWSMKSLQIVICNLEAKKQEVINVFRKKSKILYEMNQT